MTREEWLRHAVEELDAAVFNGDLDLLNHDFQIACGRTRGGKPTECVQPSEGININMDDFFPTTIGVSYLIRDNIEMLIALAKECIHAFFNIQGNGKQFKKTAEKYMFIDGGKEASLQLQDIIKETYARLKKKYGDFPGKPVSFAKKETKQGKNGAVVYFCPECGFEAKVTRKMFEKHKAGKPTCVCGCKMAIDHNTLEPADDAK